MSSVRIRSSAARARKSARINAEAAGQILHENPWFLVRERNTYFTIEYRQPQVLVLPVVEDDAVVMVRVKRPVIDDNPLELPAGGIEPGESLSAGAARELQEETGIVVSDIRRFVPLPALSPSPNRMPAPFHIFRVDLSSDEFLSRGPHDGEVTSVECVSLRDAAALVASGEIYVAAPVAVLARFLLSKYAARYQRPSARPGRGR